ncbi:MAG: phage holin family protein [Pyrinomonas methylaliphatogenes]|jgi:uncharacterized membrane protein YqjE|nr:phage holin family protein [Pyrinomonas methylaliphatogenes]
MAETERSVTTKSPTELESLPALFGRLGDDVLKLMDTKISLLRIELREEITNYVRGLILTIFGASLALIGLALLGVAAALYISGFMSAPPPNHYALGFLAIGLFFGLAGALLSLMMKGRLAARELMPDRSLEELRKDKRWLKHEINR